MTVLATAGALRSMEERLFSVQELCDEGKSGLSHHLIPSIVICIQFEL